MQLHAACAQHCRPVACAHLAFVFCLSELKGIHGRQTGTEPHSRQRATATTAKAAQCFAAKNGARGLAPGAEQKQVAESGAALHEFIYALHHPPLSFSLLCSYTSPPAPSRFPSKSGAALPSLLASFFESLPLQTNKQQEEFSL
jgi:hypothetical protein